MLRESYTMLLLLLVVVSGGSAVVINHACTGDKANFTFCDATLPLERRVEALVEMLDEKDFPTLMTARHSTPVPGLGIPAYDWGVNSIHGDQVSCGTRCATNFPLPMAIGATFNMTLVEALGEMMGVELRALRLQGSCEKIPLAKAGTAIDACIGLDSWTPNININRDPRWGRNWEVASEDPLLTGRIGTAYSVGFQRNRADPEFLLGAMTLKHYLAYNVETDRHGFNSEVAPYDLTDTYLPAFEMAVREGKAAGVMCSYNSVNGVPACASSLYLKTVLRDEWGFDGYVTSDSGAVSDIVKYHHYVKTSPEAVAAAVKAGCDINSGDMYSSYLTEALSSKLVNVTDVKEALKNAFRVRMRMGLFDPTKGTYPPDLVGSPAHTALSQQASEQALTLLQNNGSVLPLPTGRRIAVIGPNAGAKALMAGGTGGCGTGTCLDARYICKNATGKDDWGCVVSPFEAIAASNTKGVTKMAEGASIHAPYDPREGDKAVALAKESDVVVLVLGGDWQTDHEGMDRDDIALPGGQNKLVEAIASSLPSSTPLVTVLIHGGIVDITTVTRRSHAVLDAFYPGVYGAQAIARTLFAGGNNPGGKLPVSLYTSQYLSTVNFTDFAMSRPPGRSYRYYDGPHLLFPFGFGLSYTTFAMQWASTPPRVMSSSPLEFHATLRNTGGLAGSETVMGFWAPQNRTSPVDPTFKPLQRQLFDFQRVHLPDGSATTVRLTLLPSQLQMVDASGKRSPVKGNYTVIISRGHGEELRTTVQIL